MSNIPMRMMKDRRYEMIPVDEVEVINSRNRDEEKFSENVKSIENVGLLKPILVNERFYKRTGKYDLICGEGRLIAHQRLGRKTIAAEVIDCDRKQAALLSLVENIARIPAGTMWFAREVERMHDSGMSVSEIGRIIGKSDKYVNAYIRLTKNGEQRLLRGVDQGTFPIAFALRVAESDEGQVQNLLMDAFDSGVVGCTNIYRVRKIIMRRLEKGVQGDKPYAERNNSKQPEITVRQVKKEISSTVQKMAAFVRETSVKEGRLLSLVENMRTLRSNESFLELLNKEGLSEMPELKCPSARL